MFAQAVQATLASGVLCVKEGDFVEMVTFGSTVKTIAKLQQMSGDAARSSLISEIPTGPFADTGADLNGGLQEVCANKHL